MDKIKMTTPLVEIDGDEMTRVLWQWVKDILICPYVDLKTEYYDLSIQNRDATDDKVTVEAAKACLKYGVGVKCATITPNAQRVEEFGLKRMYPSPNATIRAMMDGTVFRAPVLVRGITPLVPGWTKPIVIARHAYGDVYKAVEIKAHGGKATLCCDGEEKTVFDFCGEDGILQAQHNTDKSIRSFAKVVFRTRFRKNKIFGSAPKTPFPKCTTIDSRISFKRFTIPSTKRRSRLAESSIFTRSSTTPWQELCARTAAISGR